MSVVDDPDPENKTSTWDQVVGQSSSTGYDPNKFFTHASDSKGHSERLMVKCPPDLLRRVMELVALGAFPVYRDQADFVRDAIHHHLHTRVNQLGDLKMREANEQFFVLRDAQEQLDAATRASVRWGDLREGWENAFITFAKDGAWGQLWEHIQRAVEVVERAAEPYRSNLMSLLDAWASKVPKEFRDTD